MKMVSILAKNEEPNEELTEEFMRQTEIKPGRYRCRNGLTHTQDCFARMCAHVPAELLTRDLATKK